MFVTFIATILMPDLDYAIYTGIVISIALYLKDTNKVPVRILIPSQGKESQIIEKKLSQSKEKWIS